MRAGKLANHFLRVWGGGQEPKCAFPDVAFVLTDAGTPPPRLLAHRAMLAVKSPLLAYVVLDKQRDHLLLTDKHSSKSSKLFHSDIKDRVEEVALAGIQSSTLFAAILRFLYTHDFKELLHQASSTSSSSATTVTTSSSTTTSATPSSVVHEILAIAEQLQLVSLLALCRQEMSGKDKQPASSQPSLNAKQKELVETLVSMGMQRSVVVNALHDIIKERQELEEGESKESEGQKGKQKEKEGNVTTPATASSAGDKGDIDVNQVLDYFKSSAYTFTLVL